MTEQLEDALALKKFGEYATGPKPDKLPLTILRRREVQKRTGLSCSTLYERIKSGQFPPAIRLGESPYSGVGWIEHEVTAWIEARILKSRPTTEERE